MLVKTGGGDYCYLFIICDSSPLILKNPTLHVGVTIFPSFPSVTGRIWARHRLNSATDWGGRSGCHGDPFFSATLSQGTRQRESGIKACGKGKTEREDSSDTEGKGRSFFFSSSCLLCVAVQCPAAELRGNSAGPSLPLTHLAPLIKLLSRDSPQTAVFHQSVRRALKE